MIKKMAGKRDSHSDLYRYSSSARLGAVELEEFYLPSLMVTVRFLLGGDLTWMTAMGIVAMAAGSRAGSGDDATLFKKRRGGRH